ncbi:MAG: amidohydrolase [Pseudomonadota bacterium]
MQPLNLALLQSATHWHDPAANRDMFEGLLEQVSAAADVVVLPEMFATGFTMASAEVAETMDGPTLAWLRAQTRRFDKVLCGSMVVADAGQYFNRFVWVTPDGEVAHYDKRHCFRMAGEHEHYAPGQARPILEYQGWRICPAVCYDLRFPVWLRNSNDYDLLLLVANWPAVRRNAWTTLLKARAIENLAYVAAVNILGEDGNAVRYDGGSGAYAPDGGTLVENVGDAVILEVSLSATQLQEHRANFPAWMDADAFQINL